MTELTGSGAITKEYIDSLPDNEAKARLSSIIQKQENELPVDNNQEVVS